MDKTNNMKTIYILLENNNEAFLAVEKIVFWEEVSKEITRVHLVTGIYIDTKKPFDEFTNDLFNETEKHD